MTAVKPIATLNKPKPVEFAGVHCLAQNNYIYWLAHYENRIYGKCAYDPEALTVYHLALCRTHREGIKSS
jgi:hypothetical protein